MVDIDTAPIFWPFSVADEERMATDDIRFGLMHAELEEALEPLLTDRERSALLVAIADHWEGPTDADLKIALVLRGLLEKLEDREKLT